MKNARESLSQQLVEHIRAGFSGLWVETPEIFSAVEQVRVAVAELEALTERPWNLFTWDVTGGLQSVRERRVVGNSQVSPIRALTNLVQDDSILPARSVVILLHPHRVLQQSVEFATALLHLLRKGAVTGRYWLALVPPGANIPVELDAYFQPLREHFPTVEELAECFRRLVVSNNIVDDEEAIAASAEAAKGLTLLKAENAASLSLARHRRLDPALIQEIKATTLRASGVINISFGEGSFSRIGGLSALKHFTRAIFRPKAEQRGIKPRGLVLLGVPGCGKSAFAKALATETGRPLLSMDMSAIYGSYVGQSEQNMRRALQVADAMEPCILFVDEVEKALSGNRSSDQTDGGTSSRVFGQLLTWLNDHTTDVFVVVTSNDISRLPPEFYRAERFDGVFFIDLPRPEDQQEIWDIYRAEFQIEEEPPSDLVGFTGAEIKTCCRLAALMDCSLLEASRYVVPITQSAAELIKTSREWATNRCLCAYTGQIYSARQATLPLAGIRTLV